MACLDPDATSVRAKTTGLSSHLLIGPHMEAKKSLYEAHFKRESKDGK